MTSILHLNAERTIPVEMRSGVCIHPAEAYFLLSAVDAVIQAPQGVADDTVDSASTGIGMRLSSASLTSQVTDAFTACAEVHEKLSESASTLEEEPFIVVTGAIVEEAAAGELQNGNTGAGSDSIDSLLTSGPGPVAASLAASSSSSSSGALRKSFGMRSTGEVTGAEGLSSLNWIVAAARSSLLSIYNDENERSHSVVRSSASGNAVIIADLKSLKASLLRKQQEIAAVAYDMHLLNQRLSERKDHKTSLQRYIAFFTHGATTPSSSSIVITSSSFQRSSSTNGRATPSQGQGSNSAVSVSTVTVKRSNPLQLIMQRVFPVAKISREEAD